MFGPRAADTECDYFTVDNNSPRTVTFTLDSPAKITDVWVYSTYSSSSIPNSVGITVTDNADVTSDCGTISLYQDSNTIARYGYATCASPNYSK